MLQVPGDLPGRCVHIEVLSRAVPDAPAVAVTNTAICQCGSPGVPGPAGVPALHLACLPPHPLGGPAGWHCLCQHLLQDIWRGIFFFLLTHQVLNTVVNAKCCCVAFLFVFIIPKITYIRNKKIYW